MPATITRLDSPIQHYAWGSRESIAALQGRPRPSDEPEAELWIGDHPKAPSSAVCGDRRIPLPDWLAGNPDEILGGTRRHLPFLVKVLAAARSLSVQVHPDAEQASRGWERESREGVPEAERSYPDPNPKHELLVALSRFEALCGFRSDEEVRKDVVRVQSLARLGDAPAAGGSGPLALRLLGALARSGEADRARLLAELDELAAGDASDRAEGDEGGADRRASWVARLRAEHPDDPLAAAPLLLNAVVLEPGDALRVRPGTVHTYLEGTGVEVMTRSDNVVRAGLTPKHVDPAELLAVTTPEARAPEIQRPVPGDAPVIPYETGSDAFLVHRLRVSGGAPLSRPGGRVAVLLCVEGRIRARCTEGAVTLSPGVAALVPAGCDGFQLESSDAGTGGVFEVSSR